MKQLFKFKISVLLFVSLTAFLLAGCADEALSPPTEAVASTPEPVLQPVDEAEAGETAGQTGQIPQGYPEPQTENGEAAPAEAGYPAAVDPYPAADEEQGAVPGAPLGQGTETFVVQAENSSAQYSVDEEFFNRDVRFVSTIGTTSEIAGALALDLSGPVPVIVDGVFTVDISTLTSDSRRRDEAIRNDWLESNTYPEASFVAREVASFPETSTAGQPVEFSLIGDLTIRNITNEVTWDVVAQLDGRTLTATADTFIFMADYGFEPPSVLGILEVTDGVEVTVNLTAVAP